jgi:hypothetical protein
VLVAAGWLLPGIAAHTPLLAWGIRKAARLDGGSVSVRSASLGWLAPVTIEGVEIRDAQGQPLLDLAGLSSEKPLWQILGSPSAPGSFRLEKPKLTVLLREDGSNLEDLLARFRTTEAAGPRPGLALEIVDGTVTVVDCRTHERWDLEKVQLALDISPELTLPEKIELTAAVAPGRLSVQCHVRPREGDCPDFRAATQSVGPKMGLSPFLALDRTQGELQVEAEGIPAAMLQRLAERLGSEFRLSGTLGAMASLKWIGLDQVGVEAELAARGLAVSGRSPGKDTVRLDRARATCRAARQGGRLDIHELALDCDFLKLGVVGSPDRMAASLTFDLKRLCDAVGQVVDLAGLALAGDGSGTLHCNRLPEGGFQTDGEIRVRNLQVASPLVNLSQRVAGLTATGRWDPKADRWQVDTATLAGETVSAEAKKILLARSPQGPWELSGSQVHLGPRVQIDSATCQTAMKFIAPVLADATDARGSFAIELDGYRIPLAEPARGEIGGRLIVHSLEVSPGPMVRELTPLLTRLEPVRLKQESVVPFRMTGGRIYHQGIELQFSDLVVRTSGSVGLADQSVALMAEMPIPPRWVANTPVAASLGNQVLRLPITGTLSRPQLDRDELAKASRQLLGRTARDVIQTEVGKQLNRLLTAPK